MSAIPCGPKSNNARQNAWSGPALQAAGIPPSEHRPCLSARNSSPTTLLKLVRLLIAFALAFSVPLQGMAAIMAALCTMDDHEPAMFAGHHHDKHHTHDIDGSGTDPEADAGNAPGKGHCPLASATISSFAQVLIPEAATTSAIAASSRFLSGIQPEASLRPPLAP